MKAALILVFSVFAFGYAVAQPLIYPNPPDDKAIPLPPPVDTIYAIALVGTPPMFPGGEDSLKSYLTKNLKYPEIAKENGVEGRVFISFVIDKKGYVTKPQIKKGISGPIGKACDDEAIRLVKNMPNWNPGKLHGKPVQVEYIIPVKFNLR